MSGEPWYAITSALVHLGSANPEDPRSVERAHEEAQAHLEAALGPEASLTFSETARLLGVSTNTLKKWIGDGLIPAETVSGYKRRRVPAMRLIPIAVEMEKLRRAGHRRRLLPLALAALRDEP